MNRIEVSMLRLEQPDDYPKRPPGVELQSTDVPPFFDRYTPHPGVGLTIQKLLNAYQLAEYGYPQLMCDTWEDIVERDAHLRSQLETRRDSVAGKEWMIQAGGDDPEDIRAAELLSDALREVENLTEMLEHQLEAPWYGWAGTEMIWDLAPNGAIAPVWFANPAHRRFLFDRWDEPRLVVTEALGNGIPLDRGRWFFSTRHARIISRSGLLRTAAFWSIFKSISVREILALLNRFGIPLVIGQYDDDMPPEEKDAVRQAVRTLGHEGYAAFSNRGKIEFAKLDYGGGSEIHPQTVALCNAEISKLISGATLTSGEGTSTGSYALGRVHENVSFNLILSDAKRLGDAFAQQIGRPFCQWNGIKARPPRLRVHVMREMDPAVRIDTVSRAANELGVDISLSQTRQEFQLKPPKDEADTLRGTKTATAIERRSQSGGGSVG